MLKSFAFAALAGLGALWGASALAHHDHHRHAYVPPRVVYAYPPPMLVYVPPPRPCLEKRYTGRKFCDPYGCAREYIVIDRCYRR